MLFLMRHALPVLILFLLCILGISAIPIDEHPTVLKILPGRDLFFPRPNIAQICPRERTPIILNAKDGLNIQMGCIYAALIMLRRTPIVIDTFINLLDRSLGLISHIPQKDGKTRILSYRCMDGSAFPLRLSCSQVTNVDMLEIKMTICLGSGGLALPEYEPNDDLDAYDTTELYGVPTLLVRPQFMLKLPFNVTRSFDESINDAASTLLSLGRHEGGNVDEQRNVADGGGDLVAEDLNDLNTELPPEGKNNFPQRFKLRRLNTGRERIIAMNEMIRQIAPGEEKKLTGSARVFYTNSLLPAVACFHNHHKSDPVLFEQTWGQIPIYSFKQECCNGSGSKCKGRNRI